MFRLPEEDDDVVYRDDAGDLPDIVRRKIIPAFSNFSELKLRNLKFVETVI